MGGINTPLYIRRYIYHRKSGSDMGKQVPITLSESHLEKIEEEAESLGLSRPKYVRQRLEAGRLVFQYSDRLSGDTLEDLLDESRSEPIDSALQTPDNDITQQLLTNLPTDEERALTQEDLRQAVFGSKDEQLQYINTALRQLNEAGKISPAFDGGYVKDE